MQAPPAAPTGRVLIVEDDRIARRHAVALLRRGGHDVLEAESGADAQKILLAPHDPPIDCVLTDYNMPGMNGLDLLRWINRRPDAPSVLVATSAAEREVIEGSLRGGACDFLEKPLGLRQIHESVARAVALTAKKRRLAGMESAVLKVGNRQRRMLALSQGRAIEYFQRARHTVGGDFLGVYQSDSPREIVLLTDVAGHDLEAGFTSAYFQGLVRGMLAAERPLGEILNLFNSILLDEWVGADGASSQGIPVSVDLCALEINRETNHLRVWRCGSPLPVYQNAEGGARTACYGGSNPLGWFSDLSPLMEDLDFTGDASVTVWTDGLDDLAARLDVSHLSLAYRLLVEGPQFAPNWMGLASDDVLVARLSATPHADSSERHYLILANAYHPADVSRIDEIQSFWERSIDLAVPGIEPDRLSDILLCLREATLNALQHGCRPDEFARLSLSYHPGLCSLRAHVQDPGAGHSFNLDVHDGPEPSELHRGLLLIHCLAGRVEVKDRGASLTMDWSVEIDGNRGDHV